MYCSIRRQGSRVLSIVSLQGEKESIMDFAVILILSNTLMAILIYIVISKIWQD